MEPQRMGWDPRELYCWPNARDLQRRENNVRGGKPCGIILPAPASVPRGIRCIGVNQQSRESESPEKEGFCKKTRDFLLNSTEGLSHLKIPWAAEVHALIHHSLWTQREGFSSLHGST